MKSNMKKILSGTLLLACILNYSYAQSPQTTKRRCSSAELYQQMLRNDPAFAKNQKQIEEFTQNFIRNGGAAYETGKTGAVIYTIPVVVHVVYKTSAQNISDAQINSQITVLNKDYQKLNSDVSKVPSVWQPLVADVQVKFCLATINPTRPRRKRVHRPPGNAPRPPFQSLIPLFNSQSAGKVSGRPYKNFPSR